MMDYTHTDYNGTDDDYQPLYNNRVAGNRRVSGNGRFNLGSLPPPRVHIDMEAEIHQLEQEAYSAVLRAFKAQSDALTWEKEGLITELRKELRVSDDEHRELLTRVNADDIIRSIREWRQAGGLHGAGVGTPQPLHDLSSPTASARKRQKIAQSGPVTYGGTPRGLHSQSVAASMQPSFSAGRRGPAPGGLGRRPNTVHPMPGLSSTRAGIYSSATHTPRGQFTSRGSSGAVVTNETTVDDPLIGRKVMTRWPEDNNFYEAVITDYNPVEGRHALVYDIHTAKETWEWVDLKEILPKDIRWVGEDPGINSGGDGGFDPSANHHVVVTPAAAGGGSGRVSAKDQFKKQVSSQLQNGAAGNVSEEIEILHTETLIREVEKIFDASHPDLHEIEKAKKMLKDHEQALMNVIEKLADASDSESDGEQQQNLHGQAANNNGGRISMPNQP